MLQRVQALTEEEAEALLRELPEEGGEAGVPSLWDRLAQLSAEIPDEEWAKVPQSSEIDRVVYGIAPRK